MLFLCVLCVLCGEKGFVFMGCCHESSRTKQGSVVGCADDRRRIARASRRRYATTALIHSNNFTIAKKGADRGQH